MLGLSYGELFFIVGATAALIGTRDLPIIARTAGRLVGRAIGYVQSARGQIESVLQQSQVTQVHKELQDTMAQLEAIRYEIRSISVMNPGPLTKRLIDGTNTSPLSNTTNEGPTQKTSEEEHRESHVSEASNGSSMNFTSLESQATAYARLADAMNQVKGQTEKLDNEGLLVVLPVSAESTGLLHKHKGCCGAILMYEVASTTP
ncbi:uncharacterized protein LOC116250815 isoform X2 [Nymphaea colorata]|uniref:uncharacterized protein LOC116250815 isoform X2 n=1 Tax=Nymphaea colorata TaxID=210225 RepID=UPI00129EE10F|nr:uncharacterized protein LOC116250815 isoform X2 [Nymphaea colorata]